MLKTFCSSYTNSSLPWMNHGSGLWGVKENAIRFACCRPDAVRLQRHQRSAVYSPHSEPETKTAAQLSKVSVCTEGERAVNMGAIAAWQLRASMSFRMYISCTCAARTLLCPCAASGGATAAAVQKHVCLLTSSLSGRPGQTLVGEQYTEGLALFRSFFPVSKKKKTKQFHFRRPQSVHLGASAPPSSAPTT